MYLLSPESYNRIILEKMAHQGLDRDMYNIIANKKIEDAEKWYLYRQILVKFANKSRHIDVGTKRRINNYNNHNLNLIDAASQTKRTPRSIHDKESQASVESGEISTQTEPIMDEFTFSSSPINEEYETSYKSKESDDEIWSPTARAKPKLVQKKLTYDEGRRRSLNDSVISVASSSVSSAKQLLLNKTKKPPLIRSSTIPALKKPSPKKKQLTQTMINFRAQKNATPRVTRATTKTQGTQDGGKRFKWTCMR